MSATNPFKGLDYFVREDAALFGGRDRDIKTVSSGILKSRTFVLYGRSGLGKTSLLQAGVFPSLERLGYWPVYIRLGKSPVADLRAELTKALGGKEGEDLRTMIDRADNDDQGRDRPIVLVFDQFEEFFVQFGDQHGAGDDSGGDAGLDSRGRRAVREEFAEVIGALAADADLSLRLVFSLRERFIGGMRDFAGAVPDITEHSHRLMPLSAFGVRAAIMQTLKSSDTRFDSRLVSKLVEELSSVNFDPAVLQVLCSEVWNQAHLRGDRPLRMELSDLKKVGGLQGIYSRYLNRVNDSIAAGEERLRFLTRAVLDSLITGEQTKARLGREALLTGYFSATEEELGRVLQLLVDNRLVRRDSARDAEWFELIHERLIPAINLWLEEDLDFLRGRAARNLVLNSTANPGWRESPGLLLNKDQLDKTVGPFKKLLRFETDEREYLLRSAVYSASDDLDFWAQSAGRETSLAVLEQFLYSEELARCRERGARAAGLLEREGGRHVGRCLELATDDEDHEVRLVAGRAFARLAAREELRTLAKLLREKATRSRALKILEEVVANGKADRELFGWWHRYLASARLDRLKLAKNHEAIRGRGVRGALTGLLASMGWAGTAYLLLAVVALYELMPAVLVERPALPIIVLGIVLLLTLPVGALVGWLGARRAAKEAVLRGTEGRFQAAMASPRVRQTLGLLCLIGIAPLLFSPGGAGEPSVAYIICVSIGLWSLVLLGLISYAAFVVRIARASVWPGVTGRRLRIWAWLWAFAGAGLPVVLAWLVLGLAGSWREVALDLIDDAAGGRVLLALGLMIAAIGIVGGLVIFVGILSLVDSSPHGDPDYPSELHLAPPPPPVDGNRRFRYRAIAAVAALLVVVLFWLTNRSDSLTRFIGQPSLRLPEEEIHAERTLAFGAGLVDTTSLRIHVGGGKPRLAQVDFGRPLKGLGPPGDRRRRGRGDHRLHRGSYRVLYPGATDFIFQAVSPLLLRPEEREVRFSLDDPESDCGALWEPLETRLLVVPMKRRATEWEGTLCGTLPDLSYPLHLSVEAAETVIGCEEDRTLRVDMDPGASGTSPRRGSLSASQRMRTVQCKKDVRNVGLDFRPLHEDRSVDDSFSLRIGLAQSGAFAAGESRSAAHQDMVRRAAFGPSAAEFVTACFDGLVRIWNAEATPAVVAELGPAADVAGRGPRRVERASFNADGTLILSESEGRVVVWDRATLQRISEVRGSAAAFSPRDPTLATVAAGKLVLWDLGGKVIEELPIDLAEASSLAFHPQGDRIVIAASSGAEIWDLDVGRRLFSLPGTRNLTSAHFSPDGSKVVAASDDGTALIFDARTGAFLTALARGGSPIFDARFSPDGTQVVTGDSDGGAYLWDASGGGEPTEIGRHESAIGSVEFSPEGDWILTASADGTARLWPLKGAGGPDQPGGGGPGGPEEILLFLKASVE